MLHNCSNSLFWWLNPRQILHFCSIAGVTPEVCSYLSYGLESRRRCAVTCRMGWSHAGGVQLLVVWLGVTPEVRSYLQYGLESRWRCAVTCWMGWSHAGGVQLIVVWVGATLEVQLRVVWVGATLEVCSYLSCGLESRRRCAVTYHIGWRCLVTYIVGQAWHRKAAKVHHFFATETLSNRISAIIQE